MPVVTSPSPQVPPRKKSESGDVGDSGTESTPSGRSFQMAPEEVRQYNCTVYISGTNNVLSWIAEYYIVYCEMKCPFC